MEKEIKELKETLSRMSEAIDDIFIVLERIEEKVNSFEGMA